MASVPSNLYDSYEDVGIKEDFSDFVYNISPVETPLLSAIAEAVRHGRSAPYEKEYALPGGSRVPGGNSPASISARS